MSHSVLKCLQCNVHLSCTAVFKSIETNSMLDNWLTRCTSPALKNANFEELSGIRGAYILDKMRTFTSKYIVHNEDQNAQRYPMEMLNTLSHGQALPGHMLSPKKGFVVMLFHDLDPKNVHLNGKRYVVENMRYNILFSLIVPVMFKEVEMALPQINCAHNYDLFPVPVYKRL